MVEYAEFEDYMASQIHHPITDEDIENHFKSFDTNGDGFITSNELALVMMFGGKSYSKKDIDDMIAEADVNYDRKVSNKGKTMSWRLDQDLPQSLSHSRSSSESCGRWWIEVKLRKIKYSEPAFSKDGNEHVATFGENSAKN